MTTMTAWKTKYDYRYGLKKKIWLQGQLEKQNLTDTTAWNRNMMTSTAWKAKQDHESARKLAKKLAFISCMPYLKTGLDRDTPWKGSLRYQSSYHMWYVLAFPVCDHSDITCVIRRNFASGIKVISLVITQSDITVISLFSTVPRERQVCDSFFYWT